MPELPDIELYLVRLRERFLGKTLIGLKIYSPFVLRSFDVKPVETEGLAVESVERLGKRIVLGLQGDLYVVIHLMIAGRLNWQSPLPAEKRTLGKTVLAAFRFENGQLTLVESSTKKRASIHLVRGRAGLDEHRRKGIDIFTAPLALFTEKLVSTNRTLKRALTDPNSFDGIGNAYSDEILFWAKLSPVRRTSSLTEDEIERLLGGCRKTLFEWKERLLGLYPGFPKPGDITAFRPDFAVHGKFRQPCPVCGQPIQHIV
ncbi:MAG TPA: DNA-formamidopyrimidine glycosylase family protein, partial [Fimbriimonas sp.]|nr:DNA-formamidopyrimidine glycosylase family protein [Fimbriimonas sp.]